MAELNQAKIVYINIPKPSTDMIAEIYKVANQVEIDEPGRAWIENFHQNKIRAVSHVYGHQQNILPKWMQDELNDLYVPYFNQKVRAIVGKLSNTYLDGLPAEAPPHCDRERLISMNYLLESGGDDVLTCFYKEPRKNPDLTLAENGLKENLELDFKICLPINKWHSYSVQYYHGVENIISNRLIFSIKLESNPDFETFKQQYSHLLTTE